MTDLMFGDSLGASDAAEIRREINGLFMSPDTYTRVITAIRGLFPQVNGFSDAAAVQLVMRDAAISWVAMWEGMQAGNPDAAAAAARQQAMADRASAEDAARTELDADIVASVPN